MARTESIEAVLGELRAATAVAGVTTATTRIGIPLASIGTNSAVLGSFGAEWMSFSVDSGTAGESAAIALCPWISVLKTTDNNATFTDYSEAAQDNDTGHDVVLNSLDTRANGDMLYVGSHVPWGGIYYDLSGGAANDTASVLSLDIWNGASWEDLTISDGTDVAGDTLKQSGAITFTVPASWAARPLNNILHGTTAFPSAGIDNRIFNDPLYWGRFEVSVQLDATSSANSITALNRFSPGLYVGSGGVYSQRVATGYGAHGAAEVIAGAGTPAVWLSVGKLANGKFAGSGVLTPTYP